MTDLTRTAADLFDALVTEANNWACDDEHALINEFDRMTPPQVLDAIGESTLVPSDLYNAILGALTTLDPATYT